MWWPSAAFRLIRPPVLVFPPSVAAQGAVGALTNSVRPTAPLPVASWIALGRARLLHANAMAANPDVLLDAGQLPLPCNKRRPGSPMVCDLADPSSGARPKRRFPEQPPAEVMMDVTDAVISDDQVGSGVDTASTPAAERGYDPVLAASNVKQRIRKSRYWVPTDLGQLHGGSGTSSSRKDLVFTVLSYNVLAQGLLEDNPYLYQHCHEEVLQWPLRRQNLLAELREANADILCLQELQKDHYELDFKPELEKMGYGCLYKQRTGDKRDGCGIFFRKSVFELDRFEPIEYSRSDVTVLDRDNVALIAMLKPVAGAAKFGKDFRLCVSTTHLLFNPRRGDIKLAQLCLLLAEIDRLAFCGDSPDGVPLYFPILLCGDMNSEPHSPLYTFLTRGSLCYEGLLSGDVSGQSDGANRGRYVPLDASLRQLNISGSSRYLPVPAKEHTSQDSDTRAANSAQQGVESNDALNLTQPGSATSSATANESASDSLKKDSPSNSATNSPAKGSQAKSPATKDAAPATKASDANGSTPAKEGCNSSQLRIVRHFLNLISAYKHNVKGANAEVTTHHQRASCTVDYIFYSVKRKDTMFREGQVKHTSVVEGPLRLLATYRLMSQNQLMAIGGLPNEVQSSDHLPLIAKFLLRPPS
ncbi:protein angel homolog 2 isoform X3 [Dermacentor silvarum]|nr:protein angel homolog 2 isoform X3 [Dermacentor silvarum]XP_037575744.1 protein angel homolog 2 isoform X3 [Dermacentor silvarum]XP_049526636.1 protein angel homolog 2 isoform X3 [Dermacentor silvarum]XP_049526637.1 protein angel homolog 2 isoform X3 [Dermacentor silvarum]